MADIHEYYIRCTSETIGNSVLWWRQYEAGYTCDLKQAGLFTKDFIKKINAGAMAHHKDEIEPIIEHHVSVNVLMKYKWKQSNSITPQLEKPGT